MRAIALILLLLCSSGILTGCVVEAPGGWGWHHHDHY
jgi:hypothetical protein